MKVLVCGSRGFDDYDAIFFWLSGFPRGTEIIHGGARGADRLAGRAAQACGFEETVYPAEWDKLGKRAGIVRNLQMLDANPELVVAFWDGNSRGTAYTISEARRRKIQVEVVNPAGQVVVLR